ncbi:hypothetical protein C7H61_13100 [Mesoflavibacter zeaxanthinifaciens subsp. sabulilitoris]|uniref:Gliding motility-associated C-terminal domain-containing protein n=1 Tax=Mesoflavibacter zeaxanthinifaciens subsp. sabulilitoris TaxID=1520893 RepID=A0A2T1N6T8_9FLAO|nr:hypothetical protein C7H61_13100 [Mesoflavibacter zeaxanthinifaciens subsp. sabulilitoris]
MQLKFTTDGGQIVFETSNYQNDWNGTSTNKKIILNKNGKLPIGTYFYFLNLPNENKKYSGWIYINY